MTYKTCKDCNEEYQGPIGKHVCGTPETEDAEEEDPDEEQDLETFGEDLEERITGLEDRVAKLERPATRRGNRGRR